MNRWLEKLKLFDLGGLRELIPLEAFEVINIVKFLKQTTFVVKHSQSKLIQKKRKFEFQKKIPEYIFEWTKLNNGKSLKIESLDAEARSQVASQIFKFYWNCFKVGGAINLDFRPHRFTAGQKTGDVKIFFQRSNFYFSFERKFSGAIFNIQKGYLLGRPKLIKEALLDIGLIVDEKEFSEVDEILGDCMRPQASGTYATETSLGLMVRRIIKYLGKRKRKLDPQVIWWGVSMRGFLQTIDKLHCQIDVHDLSDSVFGGEQEAIVGISP